MNRETVNQSPHAGSRSHGITGSRIVIGPLSLPNPVIIASGIAANGEFLPDFFDVRLLGGFVTKGITLQPRPGNPPPRVACVPGGMVNSIGLQNIGIEAFLRDRWPALREWGIPIIANVYGFSPAEYEELTSRLESADELAAIEVNLSCPNVQGGGREVGEDPEAAAQLIRQVRTRTKKTIIAKLAPGDPRLVDVARAIEGAGADAICLGNTLRIRPVDEAGRPVVGNEFGGLSGPALKPLVLKHLKEIGSSLRIPIIATGGVRRAADVRDYLSAGAVAVEIGTANLFDPRIAAKIAQDLAA
ncbi:MAG: dihydroorotate dehydrogenase [Nitrospirae bacterium]|nr:dihydroorotate dehydrogenase [Nitrospirota bacterium]